MSGTGPGDRGQRKSRKQHSFPITHGVSSARAHTILVSLFLKTQQMQASHRPVYGWCGENVERRYPLIARHDENMGSRYQLHSVSWNLSDFSRSGCISWLGSCTESTEIRALSGCLSVWPVYSNGIYPRQTLCTAEDCAFRLRFYLALLGARMQARLYAAKTTVKVQIRIKV